MFDITRLRIPIVQAPMAGGASTPSLVAAVGGVGGLGFLAAGYLTPPALAEQIRGVRAETSAPFGINVFVPQPPPDAASVAEYRSELAPEAGRYGAPLPEPNPADDDHWDAKVAMLADDPVPVVSFTFGTPPASVVDRLQGAGSAVIGSASSVAEARTVSEAGVDALCVQGPLGGGHRATLDPGADPDTTPLLTLIAEVSRATSVPLIAAGGITTGRDIAAALTAGASAVQLGTAYLRTPESGAKPVYKAALADPRFTSTIVTRAFSGRWARGLRNDFIDAHHATAPAGYPLVDQMTKPLRAAAADHDDPERLSLWAGVGYREASDDPAADVTTRLWHEARQELRGETRVEQHDA